MIDLKNQIMKEVSNKRGSYRHKLQRNSPRVYKVISSLRSQIGTLQSEVYFRCIYFEK